MVPTFSEQDTPYYLYQLARPVGSLPIPESFKRAEVLFESAEAAYERGEYQQAANLFMAIAETLRLEKGQPYWETFTANRMFAYENAVLAWAMNDMLDEARQALGKAAETDKLCVENIHQLVTRLSFPLLRSSRTMKEPRLPDL